MSVLALTGGQKAGILAVAAVFIVFALLSSFVFSRRNPDFPGRHVRLFSIVSVVLFLAMMTAMVALAQEDDTAEQAHAAETGEAEPSESEPTGGETTGGETQPPPPPAAEGDPAAGEQVFATAGCVSCHTLEAAGATGTVGPNLDEAKPDHALVVDRVTNGSGVMPAFGEQLSEEDIQNVAAYVVASTSGS